jgi:hypothetical protein
MSTEDALIMVLELCSRLDRLIALHEEHIHKLDEILAAIRAQTPIEEPPGPELSIVPDPYPAEPAPHPLGRLIAGLNLSD